MCSDSTVRRWDQRYGDGGEDVLPAAEPELVANRGLLAGSGLALELASGKGANALYLASIGYEVIALDCSLNGLRLAARAAHSHGLSLHQAVIDLETWDLPRARFDFISVVRYLDRNLFPQLVTALRPGGIVFYKTFNQHWLTERPHFNPDFVLTGAELVGRFADLDILAESEAGTSSFILAQRSLQGGPG